MEPPNSWDRLTAALTLSRPHPPQRVWDYLVALEYVFGSSAHRARFVEVAAEAARDADEPGPSYARILSLRLDREGIVSRTGTQSDPWGLVAARELERQSNALTDDIRRLIGFFRAEAARDSIAGYTLGERRWANGSVECWAAVDAETGRGIEVERLCGTEGLAEFTRIADTLARLDHPSIPRRIAFGESAGRWYLVHNELPRATLVDVVRERGPLPVWEVCRVIEGIARALEHAHQRGIVFGNLAPQHVRLSPVGAVYLVGFGAFPPPAGAALGNPRHLAPELLANSAPPSPAADLFGLGGIAFFLLTGDFAPPQGIVELPEFGPAFHAWLETARAADPAGRAIRRTYEDGPSEQLSHTPSDFASELMVALPVPDADRVNACYFSIQRFEAIRLFPAERATIEEQVDFDEAVRVLWEQCDYWDPADRRAMLEPLLCALPQLVDAIFYSHDSTRLAELFAALGPPALDRLRFIVHTTTRYSMKGVYFALAACGDTATVIAALRHHPDNGERENAAKALAYFESHEAFDALGAAMRDPDADVRKAAAWSLIHRWLYLEDTNDWSAYMSRLVAVLAWISDDPDAVRYAATQFNHAHIPAVNALSLVFAFKFECPCPSAHRAASVALGCVDDPKILQYKDAVEAAAARLAGDPSDATLQQSAQALLAALRRS